jgi:hypothetical protein
MKRTEIQYSETLDGRIKIERFKNVAASEDILNSFCKEVQRLYLGGFPYYTKCTSSNEFYVYAHPRHLGNYIFPGVILDKDEFSKVIELMKQSGERLQEIKKSVLEYQTKTIII